MNLLFGTQVESSPGSTGIYGRQVVEYKCHGFFLKREIMGLYVLTRLN